MQLVLESNHGCQLTAETKTSKVQLGLDKLAITPEWSTGLASALRVAGSSGAVGSAPIMCT